MTEIVEHKQFSGYLSAQETDIEKVRSALNFSNEIAEELKNHMKKGLDYGVIEGMSKPSLFKAGANRICNWFGLMATYEIVPELSSQTEKSARFTFKCTLTHRQTGMVVAEGWGSANTGEKSSGTAKFNDMFHNKLLMAKKRSQIDGVTSLGVVSAVFTQNLDDLKNQPETVKAIRDISKKFGLSGAQWKEKRAALMLEVVALWNNDNPDNKLASQWDLMKSDTTRFKEYVRLKGIEYKESRQFIIDQAEMARKEKEKDEKKTTKKKKATTKRKRATKK